MHGFESTLKCCPYLCFKMYLLLEYSCWNHVSYYVKSMVCKGIIITLKLRYIFIYRDNSKPGKLKTSGQQQTKQPKKSTLKK